MDTTQDRARAASLARTLATTLANPYSPNYATPYPHHPSANYLNLQGYTYSSTYNPYKYPPSHTPTSYSSSGHSFGNASSSSGSRNTFPSRGAPHTHWYTPGNSKCTYSGCTFTGSAKSVQIHMTDRHLIYPPGWHTRKRQSDWDADPSLKGKPIPILGTNVRLDTPEEIEAWIAERKRRWPTTERVAEKKRKLEEAIANGGLVHPEHLMLTGRNKRFRASHASSSDVGPMRTGERRGFGGGFGGGRGRGRGHGAGGRNYKHEISGPRSDISSSAQSQSRSQPSLLPTPKDTDSRPIVQSGSTLVSSHLVSDADSDSGSDNDAPEVMSAKQPRGIEAYTSSSSDDELEPSQSASPHPRPESAISTSLGGGPVTMVEPPPTVAKAGPINPPRRVPPPQPKRPPRNPFAPRSSLLRNLLLPEIRVTVSNLSQAIRFLVDNDFLENVELKPGEADEKRIEVVGEQLAQPEANVGALEHAERSPKSME